MWDVSHAFPPAVLTASGLKGMISAEWHPQAKLITVRHLVLVALRCKYTQKLLSCANSSSFMPPFPAQAAAFLRSALKKIPFPRAKKNPPRKSAEDNKLWAGL